MAVAAAMLSNSGLMVIKDVPGGAITEQEEWALPVAAGARLLLKRLMIKGGRELSKSPQVDRPAPLPVLHVEWAASFMSVLQVESVFETVVEDSPEEESTLTSKMCACVGVCVHACQSVFGFGCGSGKQGVEDVDSREPMPWASSESLACLPLELGNTISSLFGGGATPDTKENGTDTVQVSSAGSLGYVGQGMAGTVC